MKDLIYIKRKLILVRVSPGDRWKFVEEANGNIIYETLTDGLQAVFSKFGSTHFYLDPMDSKVYMASETVVEEPKPEQPKNYSLYGENV